MSIYGTTEHLLNTVFFFSEYGKIEISELLSNMGKLRKYLDRSEEIIKAFKIFDVTGDDTIR